MDTLNAKLNSATGIFLAKQNSFGYVKSLRHERYYFKDPSIYPG